eukprot:scaffold1073_cov80-Phaeocystis_antarctica.AAC.3
MSMISCHTHAKLARSMSATPHESQPTAVSHARGKYTSAPKTRPPTEAVPSQVASTRERSGRTASSLARAVLMRRLGSTSLRAADEPIVQSGVEPGLTKVTPSSGSVGTCCSGRPAQKVCGGIARSTTQHAPTTVASPTFAPGMRIDIGPTVARAPTTTEAITITPLRGTWWQEIEESPTLAPAPMVSRSSAAPTLRVFTLAPAPTCAPSSRSHALNRGVPTRKWRSRRSWQCSRDSTNQ